jgi:hypothetical protein
MDPLKLNEPATSISTIQIKKSLTSHSFSQLLSKQSSGDQMKAANLPIPLKRQSASFVAIPMTA